MSVLGFTMFGWTLGGTAERMAKERAEAAVVDVRTSASRNSMRRPMRQQN
jgi:hypothetical protein